MEIGTLTFRPIAEQSNMVATPIQHRIEAGEIGSGVYVAKINPEYADTASFCETYGIARDMATNCIVIEATRAKRTWYAACLILADDMIDVNGKVRKHLNARKTSFAPKDTALHLTQMEYGGITPFGLPGEWPILIDKKILAHTYVVVGAGVRSSKILTSTAVLAALDNSVVLDITK